MFVSHLLLKELKNSPHAPDVHYFILMTYIFNFPSWQSLIFCRITQSWSPSQLTLGLRQGPAWTGHQFITRITHKQPLSHTLTPLGNSSHQWPEQTRGDANSPQMSGGSSTCGNLILMSNHFALIWTFLLKTERRIFKNETLFLTFLSWGVADWILGWLLQTVRGS